MSWNRPFLDPPLFKKWVPKWPPFLGLCRSKTTFSGSTFCRENHENHFVQFWQPCVTQFRAFQKGAIFGPFFGPFWQIPPKCQPRKSTLCILPGITPLIALNRRHLGPIWYPIVSILPSFASPTIFCAIVGKTPKLALQKGVIFGDPQNDPSWSLPYHARAWVLI